MEMMRCEKCEALLGYNEAKLVSIAWSDREDPWAMECPHCGGGLEDVCYCTVCGDWKTLSSMENHRICRDCVEKLVTADILMNYTESKGFKDDVEIDSGAMCVLGAVGISLNDIAVSIARDICKEPRYAARLKKAALAAVDDYCVEEILEYGE